ncbi:IS1096, TnpA family protein [Propionibacterium sp. CC003-HC2]|nr:IS1096, TnpA family protein [Propionibacterium sp. CC003-HC2]
MSVPGPNRAVQHPGPQAPPAYQNQRTLPTGADHLPTDKQQQRVNELFAADRHVEVEAT